MAAFSGPNLLDILVVVGNAVPARDDRPRFTPSEGASFSSYALMQLGAAVARTTATAAGTASQTLPVAATTNIAPGDYLVIGATAPVRVLIVSDDGLAIYLAEARTWTNGAAVQERPANALTITGVTFNGVWGGSPSGAAVYADILVRATGSDGDTPDSNLFVFSAPAALNPPIFNDDDPVDSHNFVMGDGDRTVAYASHFSLGGAPTGYAVRPGDPALPATYSLNPATGVLTVLQSTQATWTGAVRASNADGFDDSNLTTQTMAPASRAIDGDITLRLAVASTITVQRTKRLTEAVNLGLRPAADLRIERMRFLVGSITLRLSTSTFTESSHGPASYTIAGNVPLRFVVSANMLFQKAPSYTQRALYEFAPELRLYIFGDGS